MAIAKVALDCPVNSLFDYRAGELIAAEGQLVVVPFGKRRQVVLVMEVPERSDLPDTRLRSIEKILPLAALTGD